MDNNIVLAIQSILAPALGISATALLMLGLSNKYSAMITRLRQLNEERSKYITILTGKGELNYHENIRYISVRKQIGILFDRCKYIKNAILLLQSSVIMFVLTSVTIGISLFFPGKFIEILPLILFITGMLLVLVGILFSSHEVYKSYKIIEIEIKAD